VSISAVDKKLLALAAPTVASIELGI